MRLNNMIVRQVNGIYSICNPQGELTAQVGLPSDGQTLADYKTIDAITKVLANRWGVKQSSTRRR